MGKGKGLGLFEGTRGSGINVKGQIITLQQGLQDKHIEGTNNHAQEIRNGRDPSVLTGDPHELLREFAGHGRKEGHHREIVDAGRTIGRYFCLRERQFFATTRFTIHYDSNGRAHIVPARPSWMLPRR